MVIVHESAEWFAYVSTAETFRKFNESVRKLILLSPTPTRFSNSEAIQAHRSISDRAEPVQQHSQEAIARGTQPRSAARARLCDDDEVTITQLFGIGCVFQIESKDGVKRSSVTCQNSKCNNFSPFLELNFK